MSALTTQELSVSYGGLLAVDGVSFSVEAGEILGLIGPNGAGKTTLIDALTGFASSTGRVELDGQDLDGLPPHSRARHGLTRTFQSAELFTDLTVREQLLVAAHPRRNPVLDALAPRRGLAEIDWALELCGCTELADARPDALSYAQQRLVGLARAIASRPRVVLLDEPAAGLDSIESARLGGCIRALREVGISAVLVDHDMALVLSTCDRVVVLDVGRIIARGTPTEIRHDPAVVRAYLGTA